MVFLVGGRHRHRWCKTMKASLELGGYHQVRLHLGGRGFKITQNCSQTVLKMQMKGELEGV